MSETPVWASQLKTHTILFYTATIWIAARFCNVFPTWIITLDTGRWPDGQHKGWRKICWQQDLWYYSALGETMPFSYSLTMFNLFERLRWHWRAWTLKTQSREAGGWWVIDIVHTLWVVGRRIVLWRRSYLSFSMLQTVIYLEKCQNSARDLLLANNPRRSSVWHLLW